MLKACVAVRSPTTGLPASRYSTMCFIWSSGRSRKRVKITIRSAVLRASNPGMLLIVGLTMRNPWLRTVYWLNHARRPTMFRTLICGVIAVTAITDILAQGYQRPPKAVTDILDAPAPAGVSVSPTGDNLLVVQTARYPGI